MIKFRKIKNIHNNQMKIKIKNRKIKVQNKLQSTIKQIRIILKEKMKN